MKITLLSPVTSIAWPNGLAKVFTEPPFKILKDLYLRDTRWMPRAKRFECGMLKRHNHGPGLLSRKHYEEANKLLKAAGLPELREAAKLCNKLVQAKSRGGSRRLKK
jgi:hypothetical protein